MDYSKLTKSELISIIEENKNKNLDKSRDLFISNISHDVRTLLNAIYGNAQILDNDNTLNTNQKKSVKRIIDASSSMIDLINNIINISTNNGDDKVVLYEFNLNELLKNIYSIFNTITQEKGIRLNLDIELSDDFIIKTDKNKLFYILLNLVGNALKFTEHGSIDIKCKLVNQNILFEIIDTGIGIESEMISEITKDYTRGKNSSKIEGYGLGLGIVLKNLTLLGSTLIINSKVNKGSTFSFELQNIEKCIDFESTKNDILQMQEIDSIQKTKDFTILVYAKNEDEISILTTYFNTRNINFKHIDNIEEAKKQINSKPYNMVFLDSNKLNKDELSFWQIYKKANKTTPIITLTSSVMSSDLQKLNKISTTYIIEPYSFKDIDQSLIIFSKQKFNYKQITEQTPTQELVISEDLKIKLIKESNLGNYKSCSSLINNIQDDNTKEILINYLEQYDFDKIQTLLKKV
ncbi:MAG: ATP-binding protein [Poseidonibacter sp.]|uniref:ATP-binding response regulator n=1 Tax=Poseidonibacter sp. TaxID=2321188 RepID=UPI00359E543D